MAKPLRYGAAGAVCHVMVRGDGGKTVFEDDKDRYGWVDLFRVPHFNSFPKISNSRLVGDV